ncbi:adenosylcobinamide-phosphate synthase CbiB [Roseovarius sp. EL26]|uniref:adenosylcobinamide-phosphate synthase CbiB n=1 Tax=Roseovarius sp. EL26 TaxID=2126672 RepID=UPI000EA02939|nr:adenosylcobinamide-phosphate synthase CbiB [Roseovarius sp. EL26]
MTLALCLGLAMVLDATFGEPKWLWDRVPHPAVLMGRVVGFLDKTLNVGDQRRLKGVVAMAILAMLALILGNVIATFGGVAEVCVAAVLLAHKSLVDHVRAVGRALRLSRNDARLMVARIVGRDTKDMSGSQIARAAIESAAENFSDGVIAPAVWFLIGGLPGLLLYKFTNTADSMIGYRTERYEEFGWAAARFDDLLNLIPARLTAVLFTLSHGQVNQWRAIATEARLHRSPNAGWPEAALARGLDVALSGPRSYEGQRRDFPYVNETGRKLIGAPEISAACSALWRAWSLSLGFVLILALLCI